MARRGPKPQPVEQKRRTVGARQRTKAGQTRKIQDPIIVGGRPDGMAMPVDLTVGEGDVWCQIVPLLERSGLLDVVDVVSLRQLCVVVDGLEQARVRLIADGWYVESPNGYRIAHPAVGVLRQFLAEFRQWSDRFGLDPAARAGLVGAGVKPHDVPDEDEAPARLRAVK